jgi:hypothetical protein
MCQESPEVRERQIWGMMMRHTLVLIGLLGLVTLGAAAQAVPNNSLLLALPFASPFAANVGASAAGPTPAPSTLSADMEATAFPSVGALAASNALGTTSSGVSLDPDPQVVQGVYQTYKWQAYVGYTFFRFYESSHPTVRENQNGVNWSIVYYLKDWVGLDGEMSATYGTQNGQDSWFLFGGGGPRFRWSGPRGLEVWGHGLVGYTHFTPQTPFGKQQAFAYEVGGGVDIGGHYKRWAIRLSGDMIGSHYFSTYQFSPKVGAGFVFKF